MPFIIAVLTPAVALLPCLPIWLREPADEVGMVAALICIFIFLALVLAGFMPAARVAGWDPKRVALALGGAVGIWLGVQLVSYLLGGEFGDAEFAATFLALPAFGVFLVAVIKSSSRRPSG